MNKEILHILMLEDNELDAELNLLQLSLLEEYECSTKIIQDKKDYLNELTVFKPDLILCDFNLPSYNGMEALKDLNNLGLNIPFIFVTGTMQEEIAADAIKAGAWDYVVKDRLFRLPLAIRGVLKLKKEKDIAIAADNKNNRLLKGIDETSMQVVVIDKNLKIDYANYNFLKVNEFKLNNILGRTLADIFSTKDLSLQETIDKIFIQRGKFKGNVKIIRENGTEYWEDISATPVFNDNYEFEGYTIIADNITKQKELESNLMRSLEDLQILNKELELSKEKAEESDRLKTAFLANLSHEIRTPMNGILGFAELLKYQSITEQELGYYADIIEQSGKRMLNIINDLVDISKIEANQIVIECQETNFCNLITNLCKFFEPVATNKGITLTCENNLTEPDQVILIDKLKTEQIITNLINNSLKFTKKGSIRVKYYITDSELSISIKDTGIGITPDMKDIIFERFRQADDNYLKETEGSGLGLSIAKSFVEKMGGKIWVESEYGKGSEFFVKIPLGM